MNSALPVASSVALEGVSETMLWTLHNRASEAKRPDACLVDPDAVRILAVLSRIPKLNDIPPTIVRVYT